MNLEVLEFGHCRQMVDVTTGGLHDLLDFWTFGVWSLFGCGGRIRDLPIDSHGAGSP